MLVTLAVIDTWVMKILAVVQGGGGGGGSLRLFTSLRVLRMARLVRLVRARAGKTPAYRCIFLVV